MGKVIHCECGLITRKDTDNELIEAIIEHVHLAHPELVGKLSHEDILSMAVEA
jgi:predicted small metal-binding protein